MAGLFSCLSLHCFKLNQLSLTACPPHSCAVNDPISLFSHSPNSTNDYSGPYPVGAAGELFTLSLVPRAIPSPDVDSPRNPLRSQLPVFLQGDHGDDQTGVGGSDVEITQIERWRRSPRTRDEEWFLVQTGASLGDIRSLGAVAEFARSCAKSRRQRVLKRQSA